MRALLPSLARLLVRSCAVLAGAGLAGLASGAGGPRPAPASTPRAAAIQSAALERAGGPELGSGPIAALWARVSSDTPPSPAARALAPWPRWEELAWDRDASWRRWSELVRALGRPGASGSGAPAAGRAEHAGGARADPSAAGARSSEAGSTDGSLASPAMLRCALSACALAQGRHDDAWLHLVRAGDAGALAALLPHLLPGVPLEHPVLAGGVPAPLPDGALLAPALPPAPSEDQPFAACEMRSAPFAVGDATLTLRVFFEPGDGVQIDVAHRSGGAATLALRIPHPLEASIARLYLDWDELPAPQPIVRVTLSAEVPEVSLWANLTYHPPAFSHTLPTALPSAFVQAGVRVADEASARARCFAVVLAELYGVPLALERREARLAPLELRAGADLELGALVSAAERFLLEPPVPASPPGPEKGAESPDAR